MGVNRTALVIGGAVLVLGAAVALVLLLAGDSSEPSASQDPPRSLGSAVVVGPAGGGAAPQLPAGTGFQPNDGTHPRDYVIGDTRVRDHRTGNHPPMDIPPNVHPPEGRQIPSTLTHELAQKVKAVMIECVASVPREARGDKPRLEGQISIAIKERKASITKSTVQLRNVTGDTVDPAKQCIESKVIGIENPSGDEADLDDYTINISFALP
jgi:hypothetical protein